MSTPTTPPRDNLIRAQHGIDLVRQDGETMPTLAGHFAVFDQWTEINSIFEGNFMERFAPGSFKKTFRENRDQMRVLFQHGHDPSIGDKVLGPIRTLKEDEVGANYAVPMLDTSYNRDLIPGLEAGLYGSSMRFRVMKEEFVSKPKRSKTNPDGLPERTVQEAQVREFGPVTFPAYAGATAGLRSLTDEFMFGKFIDDPDRLRELIAASGARIARTEPEPPEATTPEAEPERSDATTPESAQVREVIRLSAETKVDNGKVKAMTIEEMVARQEEIDRELAEIAKANIGEVLAGEDDERWTTLRGENDDLEKRIKAQTERDEYLRSRADRPENREAAVDTFVSRRPGKDTLPDNVFDVTAYHERANSQEQLARLYTDGAKRALDSAVYPDDRVEAAETNKHIERLLAKDSGTREFARHILATGSPAYRRGFGKTLKGEYLTAEEQRAMTTFSGAGGGFAVPYQLDPTIILSSSGVINPLRQMARVETITSNEWRGITSAGVTASYAAEAALASDNSPTLAQPTINPERAQAFVPFSWEIGQDWGSLESEMARAFADAKDILEATAFLTGAGHGSSLPLGVLRASGTIVGSVGNTVFAAADLYALERAVPPRFRAQAKWLGNKTVFQTIRQLDTAGGANLWTQLQYGYPANLVGYPAYELSTMPSAYTSGASVLMFGDFSQFLIVDRIGMSVSVIPHLFGGTAGFHPPTGESGLYSFWRNSSGVTTSNAFRVGTIT
jgi:HK97 family phage major capsid protein/HK97 family phage prohead protease